MAWGDWDGDGDLDLAAGNFGEPNRVYENAAGWRPCLGLDLRREDNTWSVAWGDWDGDGDLDLAAGNYDEANRVYENDGPAADSLTLGLDLGRHRRHHSVAWGDWDGDGDLDLAAGNTPANRVYENDGWAATPASVWTSAETDDHQVAWGDWDGDGDLDLAAGNSRTGQPRVRERRVGSHSLASVWTSATRTGPRAWRGATGTATATSTSPPGTAARPTGSTRTTGRHRLLTSAWTSADSDDTVSVAWGDWDGDGDLDLAVGNEQRQPNRVYENTAGIAS